MSSGTHQKQALASPAPHLAFVTCSAASFLASFPFSNYTPCILSIFQSHSLAFFIPLQTFYLACTLARSHASLMADVARCGAHLASTQSRCTSSCRQAACSADPLMSSLLPCAYAQLMACSAGWAWLLRQTHSRQPKPLAPWASQPQAPPHLHLQARATVAQQRAAQHCQRATAKQGW